MGGKTHKDLPSHALSVADWPKSTVEAFDSHSVPQDDKMEQRPRFPYNLSLWVKQAKNRCLAESLVYGAEHLQERLDCVAALERLSEEDVDVFPTELVFGWFEELSWRYVEECKELLSVAETDDMRIYVCFFTEHCKKGEVITDPVIEARIKIKRVNNVFEVETAASPWPGGSGPARP